VKVYAFEFCPCRWESDYGVVSLHLSKRGALKAMVTHKCNHVQEQRDQVLEYGKEWGKVVDIGWPESWRIREFEVLG
jgi:hypothetical protein